MGSLFSFSGLTFYGGLICAALAIWWYARKHGIGFWQLNDAAAPGLMLAYAIGRIGCQVSGDGTGGYRIAPIFLIRRPAKRSRRSRGISTGSSISTKRRMLRNSKGWSMCRIWR